MDRVAVIGAGPLGLSAMKNLEEEGFDVTGFEARGFVGGIWHCSTDSALSVTEKTIFNSSRYRSAFSDYPFDDDVDAFPTWQQLDKYLNGYCDHFDLRPHIQLNSRITNVMREEKQWVLEVSSKNKPARLERFDRIVVATGSFVQPKVPKFDGMELFQGRKIHAMDFQTPSMYDGQNVLIVGLHATTQDVAKVLHGHAKKLYLAHKSGVLLLSHYMPDGATFDQDHTLSFMFFQAFMETWFPGFFMWLAQRVLLSMSKKAFPNQPKSWKFDPTPTVATTPPLIVDKLYDLMISGWAEPVDNIQRVIGPKSIELTDGRLLNNIDSIIFCTGYDMVVPFLSGKHNPYDHAGAPPYLYRNIFPLHSDPDVRNSLAFVGHGAIPFPGFVQHELITMAIAQVWRGRSPLPPYEEMKAWHRRQLQWREERKAMQKQETTFYVAFVPFADSVRWLNWAAGAGIYEHFSWFSWRAWAFWWKDRAFYRKVKSGLFSPSIWRLFDMGKRKTWDGAKQTIYKDNELADRNKAKMAEELKKKEEQNESKKVV